MNSENVNSVPPALWDRWSKRARRVFNAGFAPFNFHGEVSRVACWNAAVCAAFAVDGFEIVGVVAEGNG